MKILLVLAFAVLITTVVISGCTQQPSGPSGGTPTGGGQPISGQITQSAAEEQALQTVSQEVDQAIGSITLEEVQNELLQQG